MSELIKSKNYERLADLMEQGARLPVGYKLDGVDLWFGCTEYHAPKQEDDPHHYGAADDEDYRGVYTIKRGKEEARKEFVKECADAKLFFIDPASQQRTPAELAAGEMVEALAQMCEMWQAVAGLVPPVANEQKYLNALKVIKKARGEK
ncbi:MAG: hypothetical protein AB7F32_04995 [Victivallaceae bacterium]